MLTDDYLHALQTTICAVFFRAVSQCTFKIFNVTELTSKSRRLLQLHRPAMWSITARSQSLQLLLQSRISFTKHSVMLVGSHGHVAAPYMCSRSLSIARLRSRSRHGASLTVAMAKPWRPDMNDVDRLSRGDGARKRGTGNFNIPHRLNQDERPVYEAAKKKVRCMLASFTHLD